MKGYSIKLSDWETIYPIGSIYMSTNTTSPAAFLGGTWEQIKDKFLLCSGNTYSNGSSGGNATINLAHVHSTGNHTLTSSEIPSTPVAASQYGNAGKADKGESYCYDYQFFHSVARNFPNTSFDSMITSSNGGSVLYPLYVQGGGAAHNHGNTGSNLSSSQSIIPPYLAVTVWKRTA